MSQIIYAGIDLGLIRSLTYDADPKREESDTDTVYFGHTIEVETIFSVPDDGLFVPALQRGETSPAAVMARLEHMLLLDRQAFVYSAGGTVLIAIPQPPDSANGPKPMYCKIVGVTDKTFRIRWGVRVATPCPDTQQVFATNRWDQEHDIDQKGYSTFTTSGTLTMRSDMRQANPDGKDMRNLVVYPVRNDCRRAYNWRLSRDGLTLHYKITDTQVYLLPPAGAVDATMKLGITTQNGGVWKTRVSLTIEGWKGQPKQALAQMAILMALRKLETTRPIRRKDKNGNDTKSPIVIGAAFEEECFENKVSVMLESLLATAPTVFIPGNGRVQLGIDLFKSLTVGGLTFGLLEIGEAFGEDMTEQQKKDKIKELRDKQRQAAIAQHDALMKSPPISRLGDPVELTQFDAPGIDPGLYGAGDLVKMLAAAFRDPCINDVFNQLVKKPVENGNPQPKPGGGKPIPGSTPQDDDVALAESHLKSARSGGTSTLKTFNISDLGPFDADVGLAGNDTFAGTYESWTCDIEQTIESHSGVVPSTVSGGVGRKFQVANPVNDVMVKWSSVKFGGQPETPVVADDNLIHVKTVIRSSMVDVGTDGATPIFATSGVSHYKAIDTSKVAIRPAVPPWMNVPMKNMPLPIPMVLDLKLDSSDTTLRSQQK